jgi:hypothetical protein
MDGGSGQVIFWGPDVQSTEVDTLREARKALRSRLDRFTSEHDAKWGHNRRTLYALDPPASERVKAAHDRWEVEIPLLLRKHRELIEHRQELGAAELRAKIPVEMPPLPPTARTTVAEEQAYLFGRRMYPLLVRAAEAKWDLAVAEAMAKRMQAIFEAGVRDCRKEVTEVVVDDVARTVGK